MPLALPSLANRVWFLTRLFAAAVARAHRAGLLVQLGRRGQRGLVGGILQFGIEAGHAGIIEGDAARADQREQRQRDGRRDRPAVIASRY